VLWDLIAFLNQETVDFIKEKGGLEAIVISHPHFYTTHLEWAAQFNCPVYVAKDDQEWLNRPDEKDVRRWIEGTQEIVPGVTAIQAGGHFDGSCVLHWEKKLFIADTMMSVPVSFVLLLPFKSTTSLYHCTTVLTDISLASTTPTSQTRTQRPSRTLSCGRIQT
jgi:glyoxylase-like metal-dependent hydrolase (beta-lactamase superfamily II)